MGRRRHPLRAAAHDRPHAPARAPARPAPPAARGRRGGDLATLAPLDRAALEPLERSWYGEAIRAAGPRDGVLETLTFLRERGLRLVVLSDYAAGFKLEALGLSGVFERVYSGEALGLLKPSPRLFEQVIADLGVRPEALLHVGDRPETDAASSTTVGYRALVLGPGRVDPRLFHGAI